MALRLALVLSVLLVAVICMVYGDLETAEAHHYGGGGGHRGGHGGHGGYGGGHHGGGSHGGHGGYGGRRG